jgi:hypothetical protein
MKASAPKPRAEASSARPGRGLRAYTVRRRDSSEGEEHLRRVRRICSGLPGTSEKLSHGEPTFFVNEKVFTMFANHHHNDGHIAVWIRSAPGVQSAQIKGEPKKFFTEAWKLIASKRKK